MKRRVFILPNYCSDEPTEFVFLRCPTLFIFLALLCFVGKLLRYGPLFFFFLRCSTFLNFFLWISFLILFLDLEIFNIIFGKIPDIPLSSPPRHVFLLRCPALVILFGKLLRDPSYFFEEIPTVFLIVREKISSK